MSQSTDFEFTATARTDTGKAVARRLRRENKVPGIIYGADKAPQAVTLNHFEVSKRLSHEAVYSHILSITVDGKAEQVVLKALERHHSKPVIMHIDFLRVKAGEKITMNVPLHFIGEEDAPGLKEGGVASHLLNDVEIKCLPNKLPEFIEVNIADLALDESVHLSDIKLPEGVEFSVELTEEHNPTVASIHRPRVESEETPAEDEAADGEEKPAAEGEDKPAEE